jgi:hypothetical protein
VKLADAKSKKRMYCIRMYFVLQSLVKRNFQSQMYQIVHMWKKKIIRKRKVIGRKNTPRSVNLETEG